VVMTLLYVVLLMVVRYAEGIIRAQHDAIREHTASLERWSARMLHSQEAEKKKIAFDLHEGVAQTLSAVKMSVESAARQLSATAGTDPATLEPMVQAVKEAIREVRTTALNLRPSSLDDLGLVATVGWFCGEFARLHPRIRAEYEILIGDEEVPEPLKIIIYRVIEEACRAIGRNAHITQVRVTLAHDGENIALAIDHDWSGDSPIADGSDPALAAARERTVLSGGSFSAGANAGGGRTVRAAWLT
jgi:signal transduction histidine kinase